MSAESLLLDVTAGLEPCKKTYTWRIVYTIRKRCLYCDGVFEMEIPANRSLPICMECLTGEKDVAETKNTGTIAG